MWLNTHADNVILYLGTLKGNHTDNHSAAQFVIHFPNPRVLDPGNLLRTVLKGIRFT